MIDAELMPGLNPYDRRWVTWIDRVPARRDEPDPFDREAALQTWSELLAKPVWEREMLRMPRAMTRAAALFWFFAKTGASAERLRNLDLEREVSIAEILTRLCRNPDANGWGVSELVLPLAHLLDADVLFEIVLDESSGPAVEAAQGYADAAKERAATSPIYGAAFSVALPVDDPRAPALLDRLYPPPPNEPEIHLREDSLLFAAAGTVRHPENASLATRVTSARRLHATVQGALAAGFCDHVAPFLDASAFDTCAARVRQAFERLGAAPAPEHLVHLAAAFRLPEFVAPYVAAIPHRGLSSGAGSAHDCHLVFALGSRERVLAAMQRIEMRLYTVDGLRAWFALTGREGIAYAFRLRRGWLATDEQWVDALGTVHAVETATAMLGLTKRRDFGDPAERWLDRHPELAIPAAVASAEKGTHRDAAVNALKRAAALGHKDVIDAAASSTLRAIIFGANDAPGDPESETAWLRQPAARAGKPVRWLYADALPPLVVSGREAGEEHLPAVIDALRASTLVAPDPRVRALKRHAVPQGAERFALGLFHQWLRAGAAASDKWALYAVGLLGGDEAATELVPFIRKWPGESQHARAVIGLECLRAIGSDVALTLIAGLSHKLAFAALKRRANECLESIAIERRLTREQLEDRIVPALDLEGGARRFSLRGAEYRTSLNELLEPKLFNADGDGVRELPKPVDGEGSEDAAARAEWKLFKKQVRDVAAVQRDRLEAAMIAQRGWRADEFENLLVAHPLVGRLARRLVWEGHIAEGGTPQRFRVLTDGTAADVADVAVDVAAFLEIRIAHRLDLDERVVDAWEARLAASHVIQPFEQLDRVTYRLDEIERVEDAIRRFDGSPVAEPVLLGRLRARGWQRGAPADGGGFAHHWKRFERAGVTAIVRHGLMFVGYVQPESRVAIAGCCFVRGDSPHRPADLVPLRQVSPIPISEVCADCAFVLS